MFPHGAPVVDRHVSHEISCLPGTETCLTCAVLAACMSSQSQWWLDMQAAPGLWRPAGSSRYVVQPGGQPLLLDREYVDHAQGTPPPRALPSGQPTP